MKKIPIQVRLPEKTLSEIDKSVKTGKFMNRSDFIRDSLRKPDEKKEETVKESRSNTVKRIVTDSGLRSINRKLDNLGTAISINFIFLLIIFFFLLFFGGVLL